MRYRLMDLFAGCGGFTQGFVETGRFIPVAAVEIDASAAASYRANFGDHIHTANMSNWMDGRTVPQADVVIGGPPCQGFSNLGARRKDDPRNDLWDPYVET